MVFEDCCLSVMVFFISNKFRTPARWSCLKEIMSELALDLINLQMELGCRETRRLVGLAAPPPCCPPLLSLPFSISQLSASPWAGKSVGLSTASPDPAFSSCQPLLAHLRGLQLNAWRCRPLSCPPGASSRNLQLWHKPICASKSCH